MSAQDQKRLAAEAQLSALPLPEGEAGWARDVRAKARARLLAAGALTIVALVLAPSEAEAQSSRGRQPRVIQLDEIRIEGRVQKPNAFYILNRSNLGYEVLDLRTSFVRDIVESVQHEPF